MTDSNQVIPRDVYSIVATFNFFVSASFFIMAGMFVYFNQRGLGFEGKKDPRPQSESMHVAPIINGFTGFIYMVKAIDFSAGETAFSLAAIDYLDYMLTCPLLVFDLCHTLGMHRKSLYSMSTFVILFTGVMCTYKEMEIERSRYYFAFGCCVQVMLQYAIYRDVVDNVFPKTCAEALPSLKRGVGIFFGIWPIFPVVWFLGYRGINVMPAFGTLLIHGLLDLIAKSIFGLFILRYRLHMEDYYIRTGLIDLEAGPGKSDATPKHSGSGSAGSRADEDELRREVTVKVSGKIVKISISTKDDLTEVVQELTEHFELDERKQRKLLQHLFSVQAQMKAALAANEDIVDDNDDAVSISTRKSGIELTQKRSGRNVLDDDASSVGGRSIGSTRSGRVSSRPRVVVEDRTRA